MMTTCKHCGTKAIPMANGCCPNCQEPMAGNAVRPPPAAPSKTASKSDRISALVLWCLVAPISLLLAAGSLNTVLRLAHQPHGGPGAPLAGDGFIGMALGLACFPLSVLFFIGAVCGIVSWFRKG